MYFTSTLWCHKLVAMYNLLLFYSLCCRPTTTVLALTDWHTAASEGTLDVARVTKQNLEGKFYNEKSNVGIRFRSQGSPAASYLSITSLDGGRNIFSSSLMGDGVTLTSVMGGDYLITGGHKGGKSVVYRLSRTKRQPILKALMKYGLTPKWLSRAGYLERRGVAKASANDFQGLLESEEANLIHQTAMELGKRGLYGIDSTGTMIFYTLAMRIANIRSTPKPISVRSRYCKVDPGTMMKLIWYKISAAQQGLILCDNNRRYCETCPRGKECTGGCGVGCECWEMVCGDCCYHRGCLGHNACSCKGGQVSLGCFNVFGFQCDSTYRC